LTAPSAAAVEELAVGVLEGGEALGLHAQEG
jgi:hypothetical protein